MENPFRRFFQDDEQPEPSALAECHQIVSWSREPYHEKFMAYLERGADEPIQIGDQVAMIRSASRVNTFKEIKAHLRKQIRVAQSLIDRETNDE